MKKPGGRVDFPNHHNFENINDAYSNFIQTIMGIIDLVTVCDKLFKKFKKSKLHIEKEICKIVRYGV